MNIGPILFRNLSLKEVVFSGYKLMGERNKAAEIRS